MLSPRGFSVLGPKPVQQAGGYRGRRLPDRSHGMEPNFVLQLPYTVDDHSPDCNNTFSRVHLAGGFRRPSGHLPQAIRPMPPQARSQTAPPPPAVPAPAGDEGDLPEGWASAALEGLVYLAGRIGWRGLTAAEYRLSGPILLSVPNLNHGDEVDFTDVYHISQERYDESPEIMVRKDDILLTKDGAGIGKLGIVNELPAPATVNSSLLVIRAMEAFEPRYLYYVLKGPEFQGLAQERITGSTTPHLFQKDIKTLRVSIAPLAEQRRIVGVLEGLLGKVAASRERLARVPQLLKRFRQSVLAAACSGKLTHDWREGNEDVEFAEVAVARFAMSSEGQRTRRGVPESVPVTDVVAAWELPESWTVRSAADLLRIGAFIDLKDGNHGANHPKVSDFTDSGLAFITAAQVNGFAIDYEGAYKISGEPLSRLRVGFAKRGDVIYTHKGSVGRVAIADRDCILTPQTTYYRVTEQLFDKTFVMYFLASPSLSEQVAGVKEQTTRDFVPISEQYLLFHRIPPLAEQHEIVRRVEQLFALADRLEAQLAAARTRVDRLTQSILAKAFRGELVPTEADLARRESRPYEPARELLTRIREQPTTTKPAKAPRQPRQKSGE